MARKGLPTLIRLRSFELEEKRRALAELEQVAERLEQAIRDVDSQVEEEKQIATKDYVLARYFPAYLQAAKERRQTLVANRLDIGQQIDAAKEQVTIAYQELKKLEIAQAIREKREKEEADRREQLMLDEIAIEGYRRRDAS
ncbi:flagellar FliJ family protein [Lacibacterium aquatile]|uniref:Flagellar FliJ protein n=1 Tax=Lacibacterium aquatile TaxID=1168082 RepID=A0ABW5DRT5_9PROT